jgi:hypothetical protein
MKTIGFLMFLTLGFQLAFGQTGLEVWQNQGGTDVKLPNGALLVVDCSASASAHLSGLKIKNTTAATCSTYCRKAYIHPSDTVTGSKNTFCWGNCYFPKTMVSLLGINIAPQQTYNSFEADYYPQSHPGTSRIRYTWVDTLNTVTQVYIEVEYIAHPLGVDLSHQDQNIRIFPNPASSLIRITGTGILENARRLVIRNSLGAVVKESAIGSGKEEVQVDISALSSGVYFISLVSGNEVLAVRKLIIRH